MSGQKTGSWKAYRFLNRQTRIRTYKSLKRGKVRKEERDTASQKTFSKNFKKGIDKELKLVYTKQAVAEKRSGTLKTS